MLGAGLALGAVATASLVGGSTGGVVDPPRADASDHFTPYCPPATPKAPRPKPGGRPFEGQTVVVAGVWQTTEAARFRQVLRGFEDATGARVRYVFTKRDIAETIKGRLLRDCPPDIAMLPQPGLLTKLVRRRALAPIDGLTGDLLRANYSATWRRMAQVGGHSYGVWFKAANKSSLWYSRQALRRAGVAPPATWTQAQRVARQLVRTGGAAPFAIAGQDGWTLTDWFENVYLRVAGPRRYADLAAGKIRWTHPTVKHALKVLAAILSRPDWFAGGRHGALTTSFTDSVHAVFGPASTAAMTSEGDFVLSEVGPRALQDVGVVPFPSINGSPPSLVVGGDIAVLFAKRARNVAAQALLRYLAKPEAAAPWVRAGGFISPNKALDLSMYANPTTRGLASKLLTTPIVRFDLSDMQPPAFGARDSQGMWKLLQGFLRHPSDIDGVTARLQKAATAAAACERANSGEC
jgi:alpha-glucoside transport system substrate-binding protein